MLGEKDGVWEKASGNCVSVIGIFILILVVIVVLVLKPLALPEDLRVMQALDRVLCLLCVGSKRFLWLLWLL